MAAGDAPALLAALCARHDGREAALMMGPRGALVLADGTAREASAPAVTPPLPDALRRAITARR